MLDLEREAGRKMPAGYPIAAGAEDGSLKREREIRKAVASAGKTR